MVEPANLVLEQPRYIRAGMDGFRGDMRDVKRRLTSLEMQVAAIHADFAGQSTRIDPRLLE